MAEQTITLQQFQELQNRVAKLESNTSSLRSHVSILSDINTRKTVSLQFVEDQIHNVLWNQIFYVGTLASSTISTTGSSTSEILTIRESDTTGGLYMNSTRESRFRVPFYLNSGIPQSTVYITSPAVSTSMTVTSTIQNVANSYVGVKIVSGVLSIVSCTAGVEITKLTNVIITNNTTHLLEIRYYVTNADIFFDTVIIGSISCNLPSVNIPTFYQYLTSLKDNSGATVCNLTFDSYEFLQKRI